MVHHKNMMHTRAPSSFILAIGVSLDGTFLSFLFFFHSHRHSHFLSLLLGSFHSLHISSSPSLPLFMPPLSLQLLHCVTSSFASSLCLRLSLSIFGCSTFRWLGRFLLLPNSRPFLVSYWSVTL